MKFKDLLYIKKSLGKNADEINIFKIRTMEIGADSLEERICEFKLDGLGKIHEDVRITKLGKFLRRYWIDELPQYYNLAKGDLKIVGIRPMSKNRWKAYPAELMKKALEQKPGLMGINYAYPITENFEDQLNYMRTYLALWEINPIRTDREYLYKIVRNIVLKGIRSR